MGSKPVPLRSPATRARLRGFVAVSTLVSALLAGWLIALWGRPSLFVVVLFWLLHVGAESSLIQLPLGTLSGGFLILMTAAFAANPSTAFFVGALSGISQSEMRGRRPGIRVLFNCAQGGIYTGAASWAYWLIRGSTGPRLASVLGCAAAAGVALAANTSLVAGVVSIERSRRFLSTWREMLWPAPNYLSFSLMALLIASLYSRVGPMASAFLIAPIVVLSAVQRGRLELMNAQDQTLRAFVRAVELKDPYTKGHSERVAKLVGRMLRQLDFSESEVESHCYGALLHDLGKVAVPSRVLSKPDALTAAEFEVVKIHSRVGAEIVGKIAFLRDEVPTVLFHHERLDGRGYPWGLKGSAIPFAARVLAVADTFDALTWIRPYRSALSREDALEEIRGVAGTQLDPVAIDALERALATETDLGVPDVAISRRATAGDPLAEAKGAR